MKAIRFHNIGGPEVLRLDEVEKPIPGEGEALVRIEVAGVNFADTLLRRGSYLAQPRLPETPGFEASGVVEDVGGGAGADWKGRRVAVMGEHCYAQYTKVPLGSLIPLPDGVSLEAGAAFPVQALTAFHLLFTAGGLKAGQSVLVHAAAGGTGLLAIQMAKQAGARVFGTVSTEDKGTIARQAGADEIILYTQEDFAKRVLAATGNQGVDLILDSVGKATYTGSVRSLAPFGHLISFGGASGAPDPVQLSTLYPKSIKVSAFWLFTAMRQPQLAAAGIERVLGWLAEGKLHLKIGLKLPLEQAAEAHRGMENRETVGKILLTVN